MIDCCWAVMSDCTCVSSVPASLAVTTSASIFCTEPLIDVRAAAVTSAMEFVSARLCCTAASPATWADIVFPMDQYAALSDAVATASPDDTCAWVFVRSLCVAVRFDKADIAAVFVSTLVINDGPHHTLRMRRAVETPG